MGYEEEENVDVIPSVPALKSENPDEKESCPVCREEFELEFKHDDGHDDIDDASGQWHLVNAIRPDGPQGKAYHPQCYGDKGNISMDVGEEPETPTPITEKPNPLVKTEPMEEEALEKPLSEPVTLADDAAVKSEVKTEPLDETPKEEPMDEILEVSDEKSQDASEVPEVNVEPPEDKTEEINTSIGNLTADAGVLDAPSFPSVGIKVNITSQATSAPGSPSRPVDGQDADTSISENQVKSEETNVKEEDSKDESEFDTDAIIQEKSKDDLEDPFRNKPKLSKLQKNLTVYPVKIDAEKQEASLCSIM